MKVPWGIKRLTDDAIIPKRATDGSAGYDLYSNEFQFFLAPGERKLVKTGIALQLPPYMSALVLPRSGWAAEYGITVLNAPGLVDSDYRGEIKVILANLGTESSPTIFHGARIAQMVFTTFMLPDFEEIEELDETERGSGGFGSSGIAA